MSWARKEKILGCSLVNIDLGQSSPLPANHLFLLPYVVTALCPNLGMTKTERTKTLILKLNYLTSSRQNDLWRSNVTVLDVGF